MKEIETFVPKEGSSIKFLGKTGCNCDDIPLTVGKKYKVLTNPLTDRPLILDDNYQLFEFDAVIAEYWEEAK